MEDHAEIVIRNKQTDIIVKRYMMKKDKGIKRLQQSALFNMAPGTKCEINISGYKINLER